MVRLLVPLITTHKDEHKSGGLDAFAATDVLEALVKRLRDGGGADLLIGTLVDGEGLRRSGNNIVSSGIASTVLAQGPTTVANETDTVLATFTLADGQSVVASFAARGTTAGIIITGDTASPVATGVAQWSLRKTTTAGQHELRLRHDFGVSTTFDWKVIRV